MNCTKFFISCSLILSAVFCAYVLTENHPADLGISRFEVWWPNLGKQPLPDIDHFNFVTLFSEKEPFIVPLKIHNSEWLPGNSQIFRNLDSGLALVGKE